MLYYMSGVNSNSTKVDKYKKRDKKRVIFFPARDYKKSKNNSMPTNSKDIEYSRNGYSY